MVSRFLEFKTEINEYFQEHYNHMDFKKIINGVNTHEKLHYFYYRWDFYIEPVYGNSRNF